MNVPSGSQNTDPFRAPPEKVDDAATKESASYGKNDLDADASTRDHHRSQGFKQHAYKGTILILWCLMASIALAILVLSYHMLLPKCMRYLSPEELADLQKVLGVFLVSGLLADNARRLLNK